MEIIQLTTWGNSLGTRVLGERIRRHVETLIEQGEVIHLDFGGVQVASPSFVDELVGKLFLKYGQANLRGRLRVVDASPEVQALVRRMVAERMKESVARGPEVREEGVGYQARSEEEPHAGAAVTAGVPSPGPELDPFQVLDAVQCDYLTYVRTFQRFQNPEIRDWVLERVQSGTLLWKPPFVQLSRPFAPGAALETLVEEGLLHPDTPPIFRAPADPASPPVSLYRHQSDAIRAILGPQSTNLPTYRPANTVVATGTGSGKSFAFGIPIVSEALRARERDVRGIKAVIVYPMNALANSQYDDFARRLDGTGLRIALYTGDTAHSPAEALERYRRATGRETPYDSEVLSRQEIQEHPPDILMTNYVMLELLLTRFEDRRLFAQPGVLRFLVLDEVHTYTGKRGADVAALIRRLKQHTHTGGKRAGDGLRCIATSATVEAPGAGGLSAAEAVADFAQRLFGEPFAPQNVVTESYAPLPDDLPPLTRAIAGALASGPRTVPQLSDDLDVPIDQVQQALLHSPFSNLHSLVPKLHAFFSQGRAIAACLDPAGPHLNDRGERVCPICAQEGRERPTFPMVFCRACGQEYWSVAVDREGRLHPANLDDVEAQGRLGYLLAGHPEIELPDHWLTSTGKVRGGKRGFTDVVPERQRLCPDCSTLLPSHHGTRNTQRVSHPTDCDHPNVFPVTFLPAPFLLCPTCGIVHDRRPREFNKLFTFGSVGRSTATDVLVNAQVQALPPQANKIIAFSDNRQDTALQAAHMNSLHRRFTFRQTLYTALGESHATMDGPSTDSGHGDWLDLTNVGMRIFDTQRRHGVQPTFRKGERAYGGNRRAEQRYQRYLAFVTLRELRGTHRRTHQNLEDVGLLRVGYSGLDECATDDAFWDDVPVLADLDADSRYDLLLGFLDLMRQRLAVAHEAALRPTPFLTEVLARINEDAFAHDEVFHGPIGYSDSAERGWGYTVYRFTGSNTQPVVWVKRALDVDHGTAIEIVERLVDRLGQQRAAFLVRHTVTRYRRRYDLWMVNPDVITLQADPTAKQLVCPKCGSVHRFRRLRMCTGSTCRTALERRDLTDNYFRQVYATPLGEAVPVRAEEHSGQVQGEERREIELRFRDEDDPLNVLVCTPTMELGIDIGHLNAVTLRNVPPNPSHYAQRAGRAGRSGQPALITVFAGVGSARGPHDQYFYRFPEKMIAGAIAAPRFRLDNEALIRAHVHALVLETMGLKGAASHPSSTKGAERLPIRAGELLDLAQERFPLDTDWRTAYEAGIEHHFDAIVAAVGEAFAEEIGGSEGFDWFDRAFIEGQVRGFVAALDDAMERWRTEYRRLRDERAAINRTLGDEHVDRNLDRRRFVIESKLEAMRDGKRDWYLYRYLGGEGFLPGYAFPPQAAALAFDDREHEMARDPDIALTEYAPGNFVYYGGERYEITHARPRRRPVAGPTSQPQTELDVEPVRVCPACQRAYVGQEETQRAACDCGQNLIGLHPRRGMALTDMYAQQRARITADEEERLRLGYEVTSHYRAGGRQRVYRVGAGSGDGESAFTLTLEHGGEVLRINRGQRQQEGEPQGFTLCQKCHRWLIGEGADEQHVYTPDHQGQCPRNAHPEDLARGLWLTTAIESDLALFDVPLRALVGARSEPVPPDQVEVIYTTLIHTLARAMMVAFDLDEREVGGFLAPAPDAEGTPYRVVLYETAVGGSGVLASLAEPGRLARLVGRARELLHEGDPEGGCQKACYACLLSFFNQRDHHLLDRTLVLPWLQSLEDLTVALQVSADRFEALASGCQSDLEREVLAAIRDRGLPLPDEAQRTVYDGDAPLAIADFYYEPRIVVFVDGSPHHRDYVQAADQRKRGRLKALGYRVLVVKAGELEVGLDDLAARLG